MRSNPPDRFPEWADDLFQQIGPYILEADDPTREDIVQLLMDEADEPRPDAKDALEAFFNYGRVYEVDGIVRITRPRNLNNRSIPDDSEGSDDPDGADDSKSSDDPDGDGDSKSSEDPNSSDTPTILEDSDGSDDISIFDDSDD